MKVYAYLDRISLANLTLQERPDPVPGPQEVVLRMRAATLNYRYLAIARGHYHARVSAPLIPVSDGAGEFVFTGSVTAFREALDYLAGGGRFGKVGLTFDEPAWKKRKGDGKYSFKRIAPGKYVIARP